MNVNIRNPKTARRVVFGIKLTIILVVMSAPVFLVAQHLKKRSDCTRLIKQLNYQEIDEANYKIIVVCN